MKRFISMMLVSIMLCVQLAGATTYTYTVSKTPSDLGKSFKKKWSVSKEFEFNLDCISDDSPAGCLITCGFDTWWTNEDYITKVGGVPSKCLAQGTVTNSKGTSKSTAWMGSSLSGKKDVKHTGTTVTYKVALKVTL